MTGHVTHPAGAILKREGEGCPRLAVKMARGGGRPLFTDGRCATPLRLCHRSPPDCAGGCYALSGGMPGVGKSLPLSIRDSLRAAGKAAA